MTLGLPVYVQLESLDPDICGVFHEAERAKKVA